MKILFLVARVLLGLAFLVFGLNGFIHFIPMPAPTGMPLQYFTALTAAHVTVVMFALQIVSGILLLSGRFVPLALTLLGPIVMNILLFHASLAPSGLPLALLVLILWAITFYSVRGAFAGILAPTWTGYDRGLER